MTVTFRQEAKVVKARRRVYSPIKTARLTTCIGTSVALGLVFGNLQAVWARAAMAGNKKGGFCLVSDYHAINKRIGTGCHAKPRGGDGGRTCEGRHVLGSLICCKDIARDRWRPKPRKCLPSPPREVRLPPSVCPKAF